MHEVDQDVVVMYTLVKIFFDVFDSYKSFWGFEGLWGFSGFYIVIVILILRNINSFEVLEQYWIN